MGTMTFKDVSKRYINGVQAVYDFNLTIADGEFIVLVGPSGCGKSTTLRMVAGLEKISSGELSMGDKIINDIAPKDRDVAMVFQNYALYSHMTVYHNMAFSLILRKEDSDHIHERVMWAADMLGLTPFLKRKPSKLSGGQRQRVALGRAIVRSPEIFLLDEPLSNLDAKLRGSMRKELKELHHRLKTTMIYVTHDQIEALSLADRIVIMKDGYIQQIGTPYQIYNDPSNLFVANFIGTPPMNFFSARITPEGFMMIDDKPVDISKHPAYETLKSRDYFNMDIFIGIRPEHILIKGTGETLNSFPVRIDLFELLGSEALLHFELSNKSVTAKTFDLENIKVGDQVFCSFDIAHIYFFNKETELRIDGNHL